MQLCLGASPNFSKIAPPNVFLTSRHCYNSNIKFTLEYLSSNVVFLDTRVKIHDGIIITELHSKPATTHTYLHNSSDHPPEIQNDLMSSKNVI